MSDKILSLSSIVLFSIVLPGFIILGLLLFFNYYSLSNPESGLEYISVALYIGFFANLVGHCTGIMFRKIVKKYQGIPFSNIYKTSYNDADGIGKAIKKDSEFWFSIYCLYWNTAFGFTIPVYYAVQHDVRVVPYFIAIMIVLIYLSIQVLDGIHILTSELSHARSLFKSTSLKTPSVTILRKKDISSVARLLSDINVNPGIWFSNDYSEFVPELEKWIADERYLCLIFKSGSKVTSFIRIKRWLHRKRNHVVTIGPIATHPDYQRQGQASLLVSEVIEICKQNNVSRIEVSVPSVNKNTYMLFLKHAFEIEGTLNNALLDDYGKPLDLLGMALLIN